MDITDIKGANVRKILDVLRFSSGMVKREIASDTGLSFSTVSNVCNALEDLHILYETKSGDTTVGRTPDKFHFNSGGYCSLCVERPQEDILRISALDFANKLLFQTELPLTADDDAMSLSNYIQQVYEDLAHSQGFSGIEFVGVGLSVSGGQGHKNRQLTNGLHSNFDNTSLEELIRQRTGLPCYTESQANLCVVSVSQAGHDSENILYLHSSTILSVGVICEGNLLRGRNGNAADIAHIPIGAPDNVCPRCGAHGCIENDLAQRGMDIFWTPQLSEDERTRLLEDRGKKLGELLSILINLFDPQTVYIGGRGFEIYELLEPYALSVLKVRSPSAFDNGLHIEHDRNSAGTVQRGINQLVYKNWNPM